MEPDLKWRLRARFALENYFRNRSFPRLTLGLIVTVAGVTSFFISYFLLHHGLVQMWLRYPLAVTGGYLVFLGLLRLWVEIERVRYDPTQVVISADSPEEKKPLTQLDEWSRKDSESWFDSLDILDIPDVDDGCLVGCLITFLIGLIAGAASILFSFVMAAPVILAEVFLDAVVVTMLYRHLKTASKEHWLGTAVKRTWISALLIAGALSLLGLCLDGLAPSSDSIGAALKEIFKSDSPP
jgi:hypothetical protein